MGLFSKSRLNDEELKRLIVAVENATSGFPGLLRGPRLELRYQSVDFLNLTHRQKFAAALGRNVERMLDTNDRAGAMRAIEEDASRSGDACEIGGALAAGAVAALDKLAQIQLGLPKDMRLKRLRDETMLLVLTPLQNYFGEPEIGALICRLPNLSRSLLGPNRGAESEAEA